MEGLKTIFWDWNGTLLDDVDECIEIINQSLKKRSLQTLTRPDYLEKFEFPVKNYYENIGFDFSKESFEMIGREYIDAYAVKMFECRLQQGARKALENVGERGVSQYVLSALNHSALQQCINHYQLADCFTRVQGLEDIYAHSKVELGQMLLNEVGCDPASALMIGDTVHDFETATAMGVKCVLIAAGHNSRERLLVCNVPVYDNLTACITALKL
ncbi:MAG: HAD hydrolase-like protein [Candidatus Riflebacteria bacterium]|nr:HAD hydrolase-like protein [Candidatus Riflebacteria bacterium]